MKLEDIANYMDKIYAYARRKTFSETEAEELSQEILLTAITSFSTLRDYTRFEPWLWRLAANVAKSFSRSMGRQRAMFAYDIPVEMLDLPVLEESDEELYALLREKISMLTKLYRDIIILHYYDGLSVNQIAKRLNLPPGTITWRLSQARQKLKKECDHMEETALRPAKIRLDIYGSGNYNREVPFPNVFIDDSLSQNLLALCYEEPKSIEELIKLTGIPAYYIEERVENLEKRCAVISPFKGKYQTDFVIYSDKHGKFCEENAENALTPILPAFRDAMEKFFDGIKQLSFYRAGKSEDEINYLCGIMAFVVLCAKYNNSPYPPIPANYDGQKWRYLGFMESGKYHRMGIGHQICGNSSGECGTLHHDVFGLYGFGFRNIMMDYEIHVCEHLLYGKRCDADRYQLANAIKYGYVVKSGEELTVAIPAFTAKQKQELDQLAEECFAPLMSEYAELVAQFAKEYKKLFPKHLSDDMARICYNFFFGFYDTISAYCVKCGLLAAPKKEWICDVLIQYSKENQA